MPTKKPRYTVIVDEEMLKKIDDYRFDNRFPSRSAATLELISIGMDTLKKRAAQPEGGEDGPAGLPALRDGAQEPGFHFCVFFCNRTSGL